MVAAGHLTPDHAWSLSLRELSCYMQGDKPRFDTSTHAGSAAFIAHWDQRRQMRKALTVPQKIELAAWKAKLCR